MRRRLIPSLLLLLAHACADDQPSPLATCEAKPDSACCQDDACGSDELCDFDYICSPAPRGGVQCSAGTGDRTCHARCSADELGASCPGGGTCTLLTRFQGADHGVELHACF